MSESVELQKLHLELLEKQIDANKQLTTEITLLNTRLSNGSLGTIHTEVTEVRKIVTYNKWAIVALLVPLAYIAIRMI